MYMLDILKQQEQLYRVTGVNFHVTRAKHFEYIFTEPDVDPIKADSTASNSI